jgi:hypothetical protein
MPRNKFLAAYVGAQRSGKSYALAELSKKYLAKKHGVLVFGWSGQPHDYAHLHEGIFLKEDEILQLPDEILKDYKEGDLLYYVKTPKGVLTDPKGKKAKIFNLRFFNVDFHGAGLKFLYSIKAQHFFAAVEKYISNILLIIDDAKPIVSHGLGEDGLNLTRRLNHSGSHHVASAYKNKGLDCIFVFHDLNDIRNGVYSSLNYLYQFKTTSRPNINEIPNPTAAAEILAAWEKLQTAEKYTCIKIVYSPIL